MKKFFLIGICMLVGLAGCSENKEKVKSDETAQIQETERVNADVRKGKYYSKDADVGQMCEFSIDGDGQMVCKDRDDLMLSSVSSEYTATYIIRDGKVCVQDVFGNVEKELDIVDEETIRDNEVTYKYTPHVNEMNLLKNN